MKRQIKTQSPVVSREKMAMARYAIKFQGRAQLSFGAMRQLHDGNAATVGQLCIEAARRSEGIARLVVTGISEDSAVPDEGL